jgi:hypothetical protein
MNRLVDKIETRPSPVDMVARKRESAGDSDAVLSPSFRANVVNNSEVDLTNERRRQVMSVSYRHQKDLEF